MLQDPINLIDPTGKFGFAEGISCEILKEMNPSATCGSSWENTKKIICEASPFALGCGNDESTDPPSVPEKKNEAYSCK